MEMVYNTKAIDQRKISSSKREFIYKIYKYIFSLFLFIFFSLFAIIGEEYLLEFLIIATRNYTLKTREMVISADTFPGNVRDLER